MEGGGGCERKQWRCLVHREGTLLPQTPSSCHGFLSVGLTTQGFRIACAFIVCDQKEPTSERFTKQNRFQLDRLEDPPPRPVLDITGGGCFCQGHKGAESMRVSINPIFILEFVLIECQKFNFFTTKYTPFGWVGGSAQHCLERIDY